MTASLPSHLLQQHRHRVRQVIAAHGLRNARVFGSVLRGTDTARSDLDILVEPTPQTTLFDIAAIRLELVRLLGVPVDVLTPAALPDHARAQVLAEAQPL